jgi:RNA-directed DNA polymerase
MHTSLKFLFIIRINIFQFLKKAGIVASFINFYSVQGNFPNLITQDFLGFTIRQFRSTNSFVQNQTIVLSRNSTYFYPSAKNILRHQEYLRHLVLIQGKTFTQKVLISKLNIIIKAWSQYFGNFNSNLLGHIVKQDYLLYLKLRRWVKRQKGSVKKGISYWQPFGSNNWVFITMERSAILINHLHYI